MKMFWTTIAIVAAALLGGALYAWSGAFDIAALAPPSQAAKAILHGAMRRSVQAHAKSSEVVAPADLASRAPEGAGDFAEMCVTCHGAPGREPSEIGKGLNPRPPALEDVGSQWKAEELFWIVKNGIRMTGMPAFGPTHDDGRIWDIVAFVRKLPGMKAEAYIEALDGSGGEQKHIREHRHDQGN